MGIFGNIRGPELLIIALMLLVPLAIIGFVVWLAIRLARRSAGTPQQPAFNAAPGWYDDPNQAALLRYWDGQVWTDRTAATTGGSDGSASA